MKRLLLLVFTILLISCDPWTDCIIDNRPQLNQRILSTGYSNSYYEDSLNAEIKNDPQDNNYYYYFSVRGLPRGMDYESYGRELVIFGTPQQSGRYNLEVFLTVEPVILEFNDGDGAFEDGDTLCEDSTSRIYSLTIQ